MSDLMMELPDPVSDARGSFRAWAMAGECGDGTWAGWLEFVAADRDTSVVYATPIETRQADRAAMQVWAAGLTHGEAEAALLRSTAQRGTSPESELLLPLEELVQALDRRIPQSDRVGEAEIAADAGRFRANALRRIALLLRRPGKSDA